MISHTQDEKPLGERPFSPSDRHVLHHNTQFDHNHLLTTFLPHKHEIDRAKITHLASPCHGLQACYSSKIRYISVVMNTHIYPLWTIKNPSCPGNCSDFPSPLTDAKHPKVSIHSMHNAFLQMNTPTQPNSLERKMVESALVYSSLEIMVEWSRYTSP